MPWIWIFGSVLVVLAAVPVLFLLGLHIYIIYAYVPLIHRIFQEKPLFLLPFGQPLPGAEEVNVRTPDGLDLQGCYLRTQGPRKGVILFGLEFGSGKWGCRPYTEFLLQQGYDIFSFEMRGQGKSPAQPGYEPLQWITDFEVIDFQSAIAYLKSRPDHDPRGIGFFGLSKGGGAGLIAAANDRFVRCFVTDGIFATITTMVPYMMQWLYIYITVKVIARNLPTWYLRWLGRVSVRELETKRKCHYPDLEPALPKLEPRPLLMIHGEADNYIKPDMARSLFDRARDPKEFWLVERAKHNQAMHVAGDEYRRRVLAFFDENLANLPAAPDANGTA